MIAEPLSALQPLEITRVSAGTDLARRWAALIERYHYLGFHSVGENLGYLVRDRRQRELAALLWGAAAWQCGPRDRHLGWSIAERKAGLNRIANNTRYVIFPWARIPHLASHVLGRVSLSGAGTVLSVTNAQSLATSGLTVDIPASGTPGQITSSTSTLILLTHFTNRSIR